MRWSACVVAATFLGQTLFGSAASAASVAVTPRDPAYRQVIDRVVAMPNDATLTNAANRYGLNVLNVMWEDTGRAENSALGPNISDLTLQVREPMGGDAVATHLLPVIRHPNFTDKTGDIAADKLWIRVGNQKKDGQLESVPLSRVLKNLRAYLHDPKSLRGTDDFTAPRDTHYLVSAQHVFVPLAKAGKAEFNPVLFNYQSDPGSPAVLTLLVTRQGMSATIIENKPGDQTLQGWGQQLFFNNAGQRTAFTAERLSTVKERVESGKAEAQDAGALDAGADMLMLVQVPLKHKNRGVLPGLAGGGGANGQIVMSAPAAAPEMSKGAAREKSDVENAVLGHGEDMGPFYEMGNMKLERDPKFPVRVTVQFYRATSNGVVSDEDMKSVASMIDRVYADADFVGSLVVPQGQRSRPTDWIKDQPASTSGWNPWNNGQRNPPQKVAAPEGQTKGQ